HEGRVVAFEELDDLVSGVAQTRRHLIADTAAAPERGRRVDRDDQSLGGHHHAPEYLRVPLPHRVGDPGRTASGRGAGAGESPRERTTTSRISRGRRPTWGHSPRSTGSTVCRCTPARDRDAPPP